MLILCGPGNNGGDGGVVARHLDAWGFPVRVVWFARGDQLRGDAAAQWGILARSGIAQSAWFDDHPAEEVDPQAIRALLAGADWLVDGLLGTGLSRPVEGPLRTVIEAINESGKPVFALDLPSGLDADTGQPLGIAVRARPPPPSSPPSSASPPRAPPTTRARSPSSTSGCRERSSVLFSDIPLEPLDNLLADATFPEAVPRASRKPHRVARHGPPNEPDRRLRPGTGVFKRLRPSGLVEGGVTDRLGRARLSEDVNPRGLFLSCQ